MLFLTTHILRYWQHDEICLGLTVNLNFKAHRTRTAKNTKHVFHLFRAFYVCVRWTKTVFREEKNSTAQKHETRKKHVLFHVFFMAKNTKHVFHLFVCYNPPMMGTWQQPTRGQPRQAGKCQFLNLGMGSEMNTAFPRFSSRIVFREPGRGWLSCRRDRHLTSSSEGREHKSNHCPLLPMAEWGVGRWHRRHNSALDVRHICLYSCGKIS